MTIATKSISDASTYWLSGAQARAARYTANAAAAGSKWLGNTIAMAAMYTAGVTAPSTPKAFTSGVNKAGASGYTTGINAKGSVRYSGGIAAGQSKYNTNEGAMLSVIQGVTLAPRQLRGSPANYANVQKVGDALHAASVARKTA